MASAAGLPFCVGARPVCAAARGITTRESPGSGEPESITGLDEIDRSMVSFVRQR